MIKTINELKTLLEQPNSELYPNLVVYKQELTGLQSKLSELLDDSSTTKPEEVIINDEICGRNDPALLDSLRGGIKSIRFNGSYNSSFVPACIKDRDISINTIDLRGSKLGHHGVEEVACALATNTTITTINLSVNQIGPLGGKALAGSLETNNKITSINLHYNLSLIHI